MINYSMVFIWFSPTPPLKLNTGIFRLNIHFLYKRKKALVSSLANILVSSIKNL